MLGWPLAVSASRGSETVAQGGGFIQREQCSPAQMDPLHEPPLLFNYDFSLNSF